MIKSLREILLQQIPVTRPESRLNDLDAARGIAIVLVVIGHVVSGKFPADNDWYVYLMAFIYRFHMPLFMVLTGVTFALSLPTMNSWKQVWDYSLTRVRRLFIPYLALGMLILVGKTIAPLFLHVDNVPKSFVDDALKILVTPSESVARFLWYVYVLSVYLLLVPAFCYAFGRRPVLLIILGVILQAWQWPDIFMISWIVYYLPFFACGMFLWIHRSIWNPMSNGLFFSVTAIFVFLSVLWLTSSLPKWLLGISSVPVVLGIAQRMTATLQSFFAWLGVNSLSIYLFNGLAIGFAKGLLFKFISWDGPNFFLFFPLLALAGVFVPLAIKSIGVRIMPKMARYF